MGAGDPRGVTRRRRRSSWVPGPVDGVDGFVVALVGLCLLLGLLLVGAVGFTLWQAAT